jgi:iduronate 2-sulfatase
MARGHGPVIPLLLALALSGCATGTRSVTEPAARSAPRGAPNVLFIAVDDLRPALGCYGDRFAISPHIDSLASRGTVFTHAYCQQAVCSPSRNGVLTGRRPDTIGIYDLSTNFRTTLPDVVTLPQHFKQNGYHAEGMGKIFHVGHGNRDDPASWSVPSWNPAPGGRPRRQPADNPKWGTGPRDERAAAKRRKGRPYGSRDVADHALPDGKIADHAIERLQLLKTEGKPFFLAVGFHKPHLPFVAPKKYWDLYDPATLPVGAPADLPEGAPRYAGSNSGELRQYLGVPDKGPIPPDLARSLVHGYYACVSYTDAQVGRVLDELDRLDLRDDTIVVLWGDHGYQLGDHGLFCKHANFEKAVRSTLIVSAPAQSNPASHCDGLVEFVDIYPTLCDLAGLTIPAGLEGTSFTPLLRDPATPWKSAAFSQWPKAIPGVGEGMGYSLRTARYRLTEWTVPDTQYSALELYDYETDPEEMVNLADDPAHRQVVRDLLRLRRNGWHAALPPPGGIVR